ncbi:MAG TPA: MotA/TolQ/ExbB proton channel family protein [Gemmataceae bacterium]|nr:MotA/TolQ/ExbB proton channel family protein [Gemmataceae bacterium]
MDVLLQFVTKHAYFAIPMFGMSITAISLVIWRILLNHNARTDMNVFLPHLQETLEKDGIEGAARLCRSETGMIPQRLFVAGLETSKQGLAAMRRAMSNVIEFEILPDLNFLLPSILAIAKIATMVGLLGTVISMIGTFTELKQMEGGKDVARQGGDIGLALAATALGLVTAIPLVFAHVLFKAWVANFETRMKAAAQKLLVIVQAAKPASAKASAAPAAESVTRRS